MAEKKQGFFSKVKHWWKEDLTSHDRDLFKIAALYLFDGVLLGSAVTAVHKDRKAQKDYERLFSSGYINGKLDAYKEMATNPYQQMNTGFKQLEKQGKVTKF